MGYDDYQHFDRHEKVKISGRQEPLNTPLNVQDPSVDTRTASIRRKPEIVIPYFETCNDRHIDDL